MLRRILLPHPIVWFNVATRIQFKYDANLQLAKSFSTKSSVRKSAEMNMDKRKAIFDKIATALFIKNPEDWYKAQSFDIAENGGKSVLALYGNSVIDALLDIYPEYDWRIYKFKKVTPNSYLTSKAK